MEIQVGINDLDSNAHYANLPTIITYDGICTSSLSLAVHNIMPLL